MNILKIQGICTCDPKFQHEKTGSDNICQYAGIFWQYRGRRAAQQITYTVLHLAKGQSQLTKK